MEKRTLETPPGRRTALAGGKARRAAELALLGLLSAGLALAPLAFWVLWFRGR